MRTNSKMWSMNVHRHYRLRNASLPSRTLSLLRNLKDSLKKKLRWSKNCKSRHRSVENNCKWHWTRLRRKCLRKINRSGSSRARETHYSWKCRALKRKMIIIRKKNQIHIKLIGLWTSSSRVFSKARRICKREDLPMHAICGHQGNWNHQFQTTTSETNCHSMIMTGLVQLQTRMTEIRTRTKIKIKLPMIQSSKVFH